MNKNSSYITMNDPNVKIFEILLSNTCLAKNVNYHIINLCDYDYSSKYFNNTNNSFQNPIKISDITIFKEQIENILTTI